uniref:Uncharacterized protein n=1 Tax=Oryza punctata TaxID=4537 RepID=A0A0E0MNA6_ORYPU
MFLLNEKLTYFRKSFFGLVGTISAMLVKVEKGSLCRMKGLRLMLARVLLVLQLVVLVVILSPLAVFYLVGLLITAGVSLWRLLQRDYGGDVVEAANLMVQGLVILHKLAATEHNRRIIINSTQGRQLLSMAMAPVSADLLDRIDHEAWNDIVAFSLQLMCRLVTAPGETVDKLRSQMLNDKDAISTTDATRRSSAFSPLTSSRSFPRLRKFTKLLLAIFAHKEKDTFMRQMAGEALAMLSYRSKSDATIILKASDSTLKDLTALLFDVNNNREYRICAAEILEHLYIRYTEQDGYLNNLTEAMKYVLPKVLG